MVDSIDDRPVDEDEDVYRRFFDSSPLPMAMHDGRVVLFVNPAAAVAFGYETVAEATGIPVEAVVHPDSLVSISERSAAVLRGERAPAQVSRFLRKDGSVFEGEGFTSLASYRGKPAIQVFIRDLTDIHAVKSDLDRSEANYRQLFELSPDPTVVHDGGSIIMANRAAIEFFGLAEDGDVGASILPTIVGDESALLESRMQNLKRTGRPNEPTNVHLRVADGEVKEVEVRGAPIQWQGTPAVIGVYRDLTERHRSEGALREMQDRYRALVDQAPFGMHFYQIDAYGRLIFVGGNKAASILFGEDQRQLVGLPLDEAMPFLAGTDSESMARQIAVEGGLGERMVTYERDSVRRIFETRVFRIAEGMCAAVFIDVAERVRNEEELDQHRNHLEQLVAERTGELDQAHRDVEAITAVAARAVELRDPYTAGHQRRVAQLAYRVSLELGLGEDAAEHVRIAALLHDIGKISIPAEILSKPGRLSSIEYELVKGHVVAAAEILDEVDIGWPLGQMVAQHHERVDGSGYPNGLLGDDTLLEARVLAVADVVEAMSSHRPYRPSLGMSAALEEVTRFSGEHYDADVVAACIRVVDSGFEFADSE